MIRLDLADVVYKSKAEKFDAVVEEIKERYATGQPILVASFDDPVTTRTLDVEATVTKVN